MLKNENIICISSIDWDFVWQGHQEIMDTFARNGNRVLFIENTGIRAPKLRDIGRLRRRILNWRKGIRGIRQERKNLFICSPLILPFPYSKIAKIINRFLLINSVKEWMRAIDFKNPIIWTFLPTSVSIDIIDNIDNSLVVYYCIAEFTELADSSKKVEKTEAKLLGRCDVVFAQGKEIKQRCEKYNKNVHIFPFGVNKKFFNDSNNTSKPGMQSVDTKDIDSIPGKKIGYIGGIHKHVDVDLLKGIARRKPEWSLVLVGPMQIDRHAFDGYENIWWLPKKGIDVLPFYVLRFGACLIPYLLNEYTKTVYPTKMNEYLAMGKPVISTPIPEVEEFNRCNGGIVEIAHGVDSFCAKIDRALTEEANPEIERIKEKRKSVAIESGWAGRIGKMSDIMEAEASAKHEETERKWQDNFARIARTAKKRFLAVASILAVSYILLFYTPLFWWIAEPLKISELPRKADAITVFGGGVGETGKAGQGYAERTRYAIKLYKEGYAQRLIFSSGFTYYLKESEEMKNLAIAMGIPENNIITEEKASSTYKNVRNVLAIMKKRKMRSLILVSSPYHMRRSELVFNKLRDGIKVTYCPIPESKFYGDRKQIRWKHVKAIFHEYLGILYYCIKGYG